MENRKRRSVLSWGVAGAVLSIVLGSSPAGAQESREALVSRAIGEFDPGRRLPDLVAAANPALGPPDSLWGFAVQFLTQTLIEERQTSLASTWARWATRLAPDLEVDTLQFLPDVAAVFGEAARSVVPEGAAVDSVAQTSWRWPARGTAGAFGQIEVGGTSTPVEVQVEVQGFGTVDLGDNLTLEPGTYRLSAAADGYDTVRVTREVVPGVTTLLTFALRATRPVLADEEWVKRQLVRISPARLGDPTCGAGFFAGEGLVVTTYQTIRGAERVDITTSDASESEAQVAAYDVGRDVAVLAVPVAWGDSLSAATEVTRRDVVWGFAYENCAAAVSAETEIDSWDAPLGTMVLTDSLKDSRQGGPLVNTRGEVVGLGIGPLSAVPVAAARDVLAEARQNLRARELLAAPDVARRENHLYGAVALSTDVPAAVARITPLETWHWPEAGRTDSLPFTFYGPMGSYQADVTVAGQVHHRQQLEVRPGVTDDIVLRPEVAKRRFPWVIAVLGAVAAGGAAAALGLGGGGGDGNGNGNGPTTGGITVTWPP
jgi:hypothetical protein